MSRTSSFFSGILFTYFYQGCLMLVGVWLTPFYIRRLGTQDYGIWLVGLQILTFLLLCDLGIIGVTARDVARTSGVEESECGSDKLAILVGQTTKVVLCQTLLVGLFAVRVFYSKSICTSGLRGPIGLILLVFVISYPLRIFPAVLQGLQDLKFLGQLRLWLWALSTGLVIILMLLGARFYALAWGWCVQQLGHDFVAFLRMRRIRRDLLAREVWKKAGPLQWRWFTRGFWVSVGQAAFTLLAGADILIVAHALGPVSVVVYSCTSKLTTVLRNQPQAFAGLALPGLSHMKTSESREKILGATTSLTQAMLLLAGAVFCIVLSVNRQFVTLWVGPKFFGGMMLTVLLPMNFLVRQIDYTLAIALFAFGYERISALRCLLDGIVSVVLASILVRHLGLEGVVMGFLCGALVVGIPIDAFLFIREFKVSVYELVRPYAPYLWRFAMVGLAGLALTIRMGAPALLNLAIVVICVGLAYLAVVVPYVWRTPLRGYMQSVAATLGPAMRSRILSWSKE